MKSRSPSRTEGSGPAHRGLLLVLLCVANFMVILDSQIVLVALPSMAGKLHIAAGDSQWILTANLLAFGGLLLLGGRAADLLGRRRIFMLGTALYLAVSLLCGLASSGAVLVTLRAVHGVSAAMMLPTALSILMNTFQEGRERNMALAAWSGIGGLGATSGLLLGGVLTQDYGWQWVFLINVPVAAAMILITPWLLSGDGDRGPRRSFDLLGAATITGALVALVYGITEAPSSGWTSVSTIGWIVVSAVLLVAFVVVEARSSAPLLPLRLFRVPGLAGGNLLTVVIAMSVFGMSFVVAVYCQGVLGYSALRYGFGTSVMPLSAVAGAYGAQALVTRAGHRPVATGGIAAMGAGVLLLSRIPVLGDYPRDLLPGLVLFGLGLGGATVASSVAALRQVGEAESGVASGTNAAAFQIGGALGIAVVTSVALTGKTDPVAVTAGFGHGFEVCAVFAAVGVVVALGMLRRGRPAADAAGAPAPRVPQAMTVSEAEA